MKSKLMLLLAILTVTSTSCSKQMTQISPHQYMLGSYDPARSDQGGDLAIVIVGMPGKDGGRWYMTGLRDAVREMAGTNEVDIIHPGNQKGRAAVARSIRRDYRYLLYLEELETGKIQASVLDLGADQEISSGLVTFSEAKFLQWTGLVFDIPWFLVTVLPSVLLADEFEDALPTIMPVNGFIVPKMQKSSFLGNLEPHVAAYVLARDGGVPGASELILTAELKEDGPYFPNSQLEPGEEAVLNIELENRGPGSANGVDLAISIDGRAIEGRLLSAVPTLIPPDESVQLEYRLAAGLNTPAQNAKVTFQALEERGYDSSPFTVTIPVQVPASPDLALSRYEFHDGGSGLADGNGDGVIQNGETIEFVAYLRNDGEGPAFGVVPKLSFNSPNIRVNPATPLIKKLVSRDQTSIRFAVGIPRDYQGTGLGFTLEAREERTDNLARLENVLPVSVVSQQLVLVPRTQPSAIANGESGVFRFAVRNDGGLDARDCVCEIKSVRGVRLSPSRFQLGTITAGDISPAEDVEIFLAPTFNEPEIRLDFSLLEGGDVKSVSEQYVPAEIRRPDLSLAISAGSIEFNRPAKVWVVVANQGNLSARELKVRLSVREPYQTRQGVSREYVYDQTQFVGKLEEGIYKASFTLDAFPRAIGEREVALKATATQADFSPVTIERSVALQESESAGLELTPSVDLATLTEGFSETFSLGGSQAVPTATLPGVVQNVDIPILRAKSPSQDDVAVVIGISRYRHFNIPVEYAERDARIFANYLKTTFGIPEDRIHLLTNAQATRDRILIALESVRSLIEPGKSRFFFFFSGHGITGLNDEHSYLLSSQSDPNFVETTGLRTQAIIEAIAAAGPGSGWIFLDACYTGTTFSLENNGSVKQIVGGISPAVLQDNRPAHVKQKINVFYGTDVREVAAWNSGTRHGVFTTCLLEALQGAANIDEDNRISAVELKNYLVENVPVSARRFRNNPQHPVILLVDEKADVIAW